MRPISKIIIHCSATPEGRDVSVDTIRKWHKARGFNDIGYHYIIDRYGVVHQGRPIETIGAHTKGHNRGSIGICYVGGMDKSMSKPKDTRTDEQKEALIDLIKMLKGWYNKATVHGHNEFANKACPSFNVKEYYK